ncbi:MAG: chemotaxis-specific protein-glutamate methyltransferase CheB [Deltaproteobacteria bacterium]|nr:chemotaxis-specific protein-glutamate methyltransferase CheB [Deltaproteobacteria bacterium]
MQPDNGKDQNKAIRVLLVDDSPVALHVLRKMLSGARDIEVAGTAANGEEALGMIPRLDPHVICTDIHMPVMDGIGLTQEVMDRFPKPILVISVSAKNPESRNVFRILQLGALDIFPKPSGEEPGYEGQARELQARIRILAGVHVFRRMPKAEPITYQRVVSTIKAPKVIVIGASTGGPQALQEILSRLPADFPAPVVCVQHIGEGFMAGLVEWLGSMCRIKVKQAVDKETPKPGTAYFPEEGTHLVFDPSGRFSHSRDKPVNGHRPSITVTMRSAAETFKSSATGVLLTGMGNDGAEGMKAIGDAGGFTIAQDERTSVVFSMPNAAIGLKAVRLVLPLDDIAGRLAAVSSTG